MELKCILIRLDVFKFRKGIASENCYAYFKVKFTYNGLAASNENSTRISLCELQNVLYYSTDVIMFGLKLFLIV